MVSHHPAKSGCRGNSGDDVFSGSSSRFQMPSL